MLALKTSHAASWSILAPRWQRKRGKRIWILIRISVCGRASRSIMFMMKDRHKNLCMRIRLNRVLYPYWKVIMRQYWRMVRQELVKHIRWRVSNTTLVIHSAVSFQEVWRRFSSSSKCNLAKIPHSWFVWVIYKSTTKLFQICWKSRGHLSRSERTRKRAFLLKGSVNGL